MSVDPSGEQHEIRSGAWRATVVGVGGGLRTLRAGNLEILDGYEPNEMCHDARGQLLVPWPNRLAGGHYRFGGQEYQLPLSEPAKDNAIHGLVRWHSWQAGDSAPAAVTMAHRLYPSTGYPFTLDLSAEYALNDDGLTVTLRAVNVGSSPCPFGAGQHPYLSCGTELVNSAALHVPAESIYRVDDHLIPVEKIPVAGTSLDFCSPRLIGEAAINMDYTDLQRDGGIAHITLSAPDDGPTVTVWLDDAFKHVTVYTGETVQPPSRRRRSVAIEPMTCPPNAFRSGEDLLILQPGEHWQGRWGIALTTSGELRSSS
jgi:aldose 1-epimerase